jgi:predicted acetyltransferase
MAFEPYKAIKPTITPPIAGNRYNPYTKVIGCRAMKSQAYASIKGNIGYQVNKRYQHFSD